MPKLGYEFRETESSEIYAMGKSARQRDLEFPK